MLHFAVFREANFRYFERALLTVFRLYVLFAQFYYVALQSINTFRTFVSLSFVKPMCALAVPLACSYPSYCSLVLFGFSFNES